MAARDELASALLTEAHRPGSAHICIDLSQVTFLDSSGLTALVMGYTAAQEAGRGFTVTQTSGRARRVLEITGLMPLIAGETQTP